MYTINDSPVGCTIRQYRAGNLKGFSPFRSDIQVRGRIIPTGSIPGFLTNDYNLPTE